MVTMNLTRVLQPYVCCLGNPVAGNPTQFVMYRAARACGVDWRFFTSQVEINQFDVAFHGVQALGLSGMALFEPFQNKALSLLDTVTESAMCMGKVNVARLDGSSWLGDNTLGSGIIHCIEPMISNSSTPNPIDSMDGKNDTQPAILVVGDSRIATVMRLASPALAKRIVSVTNGIESASLQAGDSSARTSLDAFAKSDLKVCCLVMSNVPNAILARQIAALSWSSSAICLILASTPEKQLRHWRDTLKVHSVSQVEPVELMAHQAAADFYFWTGTLPSIDLIRDSFEEYLQW